MPSKQKSWVLFPGPHKHTVTFALARSRQKYASEVSLVYNPKQSKTKRSRNFSQPPEEPAALLLPLTT